MKQSYGDWKGKRAQPVDQDGARADGGAPAGSRVERADDAAACYSGTKLPSAKDKLADAAALGVLVTLVFGEPSDLYQKLVVKDQKVIELGADPDEVLHKDPGLLRVDAKLKDGTSFDEITTAIQNALDAVAQGKIDEQELASARYASHELDRPRDADAGHRRRAARVRSPRRRVIRTGSTST